MAAEAVAAVRLLAVVGAAALVLCAGTAHADSGGEDVPEFLHAIRGGPGWTESDTSQVLQSGEQVCTLLRDGAGEQRIIAMLADPPDPMPKSVAVALVADAHAYLCPDAGSHR